VGNCWFAAGQIKTVWTPGNDGQSTHCQPTMHTHSTLLPLFLVTLLKAGRKQLALQLVLDLRHGRGARAGGGIGLVVAVLNI